MGGFDGDSMLNDVFVFETAGSGHSKLVAVGGHLNFCSVNNASTSVDHNSVVALVKGRDQKAHFIEYELG